MPAVDQVTNDKLELDSAPKASEPGYDKLMADFIAQPQPDSAAKRRGYREMMEESRLKEEPAKAGSSKTWAATVVALAVVLLLVYAVASAVQRVAETVKAFASHSAGADGAKTAGPDFKIKPTRFNSSVSTGQLAPSGFRSNIPIVLKPVGHANHQGHRAGGHARVSSKIPSHSTVVNSLHRFVPTRTVGEGTANDPNSESL